MRTWKSPMKWLALVVGVLAYGVADAVWPGLVDAIIAAALFSALVVAPAVLLGLLTVWPRMSDRELPSEISFLVAGVISGAAFVVMVLYFLRHAW